MIAVALIQSGPQIWEALLSTPRTMPLTPCTLEPVVVFTKVWNDPAIKERIGCPISKGYITWLAEEAFEHGYMFWREDTDRIYTLYADHTWQNFPTSGMKEIPITLVRSLLLLTVRLPQKGVLARYGVRNLALERNWIGR